MRALLIAATILLLACSKTSGPGDRAAAGAERGSCLPDHTCSGGLACLSDLCVRPPGADCAQVADALASVQLGNYAEKDARAAAVTKLRAQCDQASLTVAEALCLTSARGKYEMARCPKPILPELVALGKDAGDCGAVGAKMESMAKVEMAKDPNDPMNKILPDLVEAVIASCKDDRWPDEVKGCITEASGTDPHAADRCIDKMPADVKDKFMKRIEVLVEKLSASTPPAPPPAMPPAEAPPTTPSAPQTQPSAPQTQPTAPQTQP